jgi:predicted component of type VI protein secretion system
MDHPSHTHDRHIPGGPHFRSPGAQIELAITRGRAKHKVRRVSVRAYLIGVAADCDLVLGDPRFPQVHAYLLRSPGGVTIRWLGQGPELTVNGHVAHASTPLEDGDIIRTGSYEFQVHVHGAEPRPTRDSDHPSSHATSGAPISTPSSWRSATRALSSATIALIQRAGLRLFDGSDHGPALVLPRVQKAAS